MNIGYSSVTAADGARVDAARRRIDEAVFALRYKDVRSTTLERIRITWEADTGIDEGLPQPVRLGEWLYHLLDRISLPVSPDDLLLGRISEEVPDEEGEAFVQARMAEWDHGFPAGIGDGGHECFAWDRLLRLGLPGLERFARDELARRTAAGEEGAHLDFLRGTVRVYESFRHYARRYAATALDTGLEGPAATCAAVAERPPETFAEALQLLWLVGHVYCTMLARNPTLTFGRIDELLLGYYDRDLAEGRIVRQEAGELIEDFYCKNNLILGRGEHQMSGNSEKATGWFRNLTYDAPQYVVLGGRRRDGSYAVNELTAVFLERIVPRFENPVIVFRYTPDIPARVWRLVCEKMRANASFMVYNDENVIPAMAHCGIEKSDAVTYTMHGCNWPDIPGVQRAVNTYFSRLPNHFRNALFSADGEISRIEDVYDRFAGLVRAEAEAHCNRLREDRATWDEQAPGRLRVDDCFLDGPVARARSWRLGGVKYPNMICAVCGLASVADGFAALDALVFTSKQVSLDAFKGALADDFVGQERLRQLCLNAPKFGQDDDRADEHAVRVLDTVLREVDGASRLDAEDGVIVFRCLETDMRHIPFGKDLGATPDGRRSGEPISENTSPYPGASTKGLTAMFRSVCKLPLEGINSGALNVRVQPRLFAGERGVTKLAALLRTYFEMGGLQVQLSFADVAELRDAQKNPERHRDLMVRITGYSAAFVDMARHAQDEIIRREEMGS